MSKYDAMRKMTAIRNEAEQNKWASISNMLQTVTQEGWNIANTIGDAYGKQQAVEHNRTKNDTFNFLNGNGYFSYDEEKITDENGTEKTIRHYLSPEESQARYDEWSRTYDDQYPDADNIWARKYTSANDEAYREKRLPEIFKATAQSYQEYASNELADISARTAEYTITGSSGDYALDVLLSNNIKPENLGGFAERLYNSATGIAQDPLFTNDLSARAMETYFSAINRGVRSDDAERFVTDIWLPSAAEHDVIQYAEGMYSDYVINNNGYRWKAEEELDAFLSTLGTDENKRGYSYPLSDSGKSALRNKITAEWDSLDRAEESKQAEIYNKEIFPFMAAAASDSRVGITSDSLQNFHGFNPNKLPEETRQKFFEYVGAMDNLQIIHSKLAELNSVSSSTMPDEEKRQAINTIIGNSGDRKTQTALKAFADSTPYNGRYTTATPESVTDMYTRTFKALESYVPTSGFDLETASDIENDLDVRELLSDPGFVSAVTWANIGSQYYVENMYATDMVYNMKNAFIGMYEEELQGLTEEQIDKRFEEWMPEAKTKLRYFMDTYGELEINPDGTTLRDYYNAELKEMQEVNEMARRGYYILSDDNPEGNRINENLFNDTLYKFATYDGSQRQNLIADITGQQWSGYTQDQQKFIMKLINNEDNAADLFSQYGLSISQRLSSFGFLDTNDKNKVGANALMELFQETMKNGGNMIANADSLIDSYIRKTVNSIADNESVSILSGYSDILERTSSGDVNWKEIDAYQLVALSNGTYKSTVREIRSDTSSRLFKETSSDAIELWIGSEDWRYVLNLGTSKTDLNEEQKMLLRYCSALGIESNYDPDDVPDGFWDNLTVSIAMHMDDLSFLEKCITIDEVNSMIYAESNYNQMRSEGLAISTAKESSPEWMVASTYSSDGNISGETYEIKALYDVHGDLTGEYMIRNPGDEGNGTILNINREIEDNIPNVLMDAFQNMYPDEYNRKFSGVRDPGLPIAYRIDIYEERLNKALDSIVSGRFVPEVNNALDMIYSLTGKRYKPEFEVKTTTFDKPRIVMREIK